MVASGSDRPAGRELVLKTEEGTWIPSAYRDLETFLHGHLPSVDASTALVLILTERERRAERAKRAADLLRAAQVLDVRAAAILAEPLDAELTRDLTPAGRLWSRTCRACLRRWRRSSVRRRRSSSSPSALPAPAARTRTRSAATTRATAPRPRPPRLSHALGAACLARRAGICQILVTWTRVNLLEPANASLSVGMRWVAAQFLSGTRLMAHLARRR